MSQSGFRLRVARQADFDCVTTVLASAYSLLLAPDYEPAVLAAALPAMSVANSRLLASGSYYVQETPEGRIVSCGGWTCEQPGTSQIETGIAHIRHFATHVDWTRKGLARGIFERCRDDALAAGIHTFSCFSSLSAEAFYTSVGFTVLRRTDLVIGGGATFPAVVMVCNAPDPTAR